MAKATRYAIILLCMVVLALSGCNHAESSHIDETETTNQLSEKESERDMKKEADLLIQVIGIDEDCAQGAVECAKQSGVAEFVSAEKIESKAGYSALITDKDENKYIFGFGSLGYLEYIRAEKDGKYIYAAYE